MYKNTARFEKAIRLPAGGTRTACSLLSLLFARFRASRRPQVPRPNIQTRNISRGRRRTVDGRSRKFARRPTARGPVCVWPAPPCYVRTKPRTPKETG